MEQHSPAPESTGVSPANPVLRSIALSDAVTPGIHQHTYNSADSSRAQSPSGSSYFPPSNYTTHDSHHRQTSSPQPPTSNNNITSNPTSSPAANTAASNTSKVPPSPGPGDILKRMTLAAMGRRESLSQIRSANPDLQLSGNIISATFNIPHSLKYRKGSDWVS